MHFISTDTQAPPPPFIVRHLYEGVYQLETTEPLDREIRSTYELTITCKDRGHPQVNRNSISFTVAVKDMNDNTPTFPAHPVTLTIYENQTPQSGNPLLVLAATDRDENGTLNSALVYTTNDTRRFRVTSEGHLYARVSFDRERERYVTLEVMVTDRGQPALSSSLAIRISIKDMDDEYSRFDGGVYAYDLEENTPPGGRVGTLTAVDLDSVIHLTPYRLKCEPSEYFFVNSLGQITSLVEFDYESSEAEREIKFACTATSTLEHTQFTSVANVVVRITDLNDNMPRFSTEYYNLTITVRRSHQSDEVLASFPATDLDSGDNGRLTYSLWEDGVPVLQNDDQYPIWIDPLNGDLHLSVPWTDDDVIPKTRHLVVNVTDNSATPKYAFSYFSLVYNLTASPANRTLPSITTGGDTLLKNNFKIVVVIIAVSGVLSIILLAAIAFVFRRKQHDRRWLLQSYKS